MVVVQTMFYDSDNYDVTTNVIPCDTIETAKTLVKKIYEKVLEDFTFEDDLELKDWEAENVEWDDNGGVRIQGGDCGYAFIDIFNEDMLTADKVETFKVEVGTFY